jgi:mxaC protein
MRLDFTQPVLLLLLPLALLPLWRRRADTLPFPSLRWLPPDRPGRALAVLWRALAVTALAGVALGLAGPGRSGGEVLRTGRGAELLILLDRSSSMDAVAHLNGVSNARFSVTESKGEIVRRLLSEFVARRPDDRFAFMPFGTQPFPVVPFTRHGELIQAGLAAAGQGRGLPDTRLDRGLLAAIEEFRGRPYAGSRIVLVVSDGGAVLDEPTRRRVAEGLQRERIGLYWIYIRSGPNSPSLLGDGEAPLGAYESTEELALHRFFTSLATPYRLFQTDDAQAMAQAIAEIDRQQNFPLTFPERVPRRDFSAACFATALLACAGLLAVHALRLREWRAGRRAVAGTA